MLSLSTEPDADGADDLGKAGTGWTGLRNLVPCRVRLTASQAPTVSPRTAQLASTSRLRPPLPPQARAIGLSESPAFAP